MKVYLSRSNAADPAVFSIVQQVIEELGHEVVTFNGGEYSNDALLSCDALVVVPSAAMLPNFERHADITVLKDNQLDVGKGQYQQCMDFVRKHCADYIDNDENISDITMPDHNAILVVQELDKSDPDNPAVYVSNIIEVVENDTDNWKTKYGFLNTDSFYVNIGNIIGRQMQTTRHTCPMELLYPVSNSPMLGAASMLGIL